MNNKFNVFFIFLALTTFSVSAQKIKVTSGNLDFMKGLKVMLVKYDYSGMRVGKYKNEEDYINRKVADYNEEEAGKGDAWKEQWYNDREKRFEPKFEELFNDYLKKKGISISRDAEDSKYTMLVHTTFTEPGFNIGITRKPAMINMEISFFESTNPDKSIAEMTLTGAPGNAFGGMDFDTGWRIAEAYAKAGKELARYIAKKALK